MAQCCKNALLGKASKGQRRSCKLEVVLNNFKATSGLTSASFQVELHDDHFGVRAGAVKRVPLGSGGGRDVPAEAAGHRSEGGHPQRCLHGGARGRAGGGAGLKGQWEEGPARGHLEEGAGSDQGTDTPQRGPHVYETVPGTYTYMHSTTLFRLSSKF